MRTHLGGELAPREFSQDKIYVRTFVFVRVVKQGVAGRVKQASSTFAFTRQISNKV